MDPVKFLKDYFKPTDNEKKRNNVPASYIMAKYGSKKTFNSPRKSETSILNMQSQVMSQLERNDESMIEPSLNQFQSAHFPQVTDK
mmetsp:Transcript_6782/g.6022  ORF Transcript_6782/g.6022 Transcript_6782/m.6022 type:complete len:86 (-) Transcript_6782:356-613(-)|eukprot:CAMPEP_0170561888 /NCGR_PEP_ID=MMETSP0211-20121228/57516_1 /TAXON_ID=311385 /ORGANISM="Pseudokeronopsis sp., Strain OXSARD2" /LENGTH=85 /DNA_ID=CAMNT_0010877999 /DNA_START=54 /DNA_END=311 /DNA_ORIENTATION=-